MHLNRDYGFDGKAHDVSKLFVIAEISKDDAVSAVRQEISPQGPNAARLLRPPVEFMRTSVRYFIALAELGEVCSEGGLAACFQLYFFALHCRDNLRPKYKIMMNGTTIAERL
jgi:hypothetical protein